MIRVSSFGVLKNDWRDDYNRRTRELMPFDWKEIPLKKSPSQRPASLLLEEEKFLREHSNFILLDAGGKSFNSTSFYEWLFKISDRHLIVGPAIGFHEDFKRKAQQIISLSPLTFTHSLAQTMLAESLYRAACQLKNHPFVK